MKKKKKHIAYTCQCVLGFNGTTCNNNIDDCSPNPCLNDGSCVDGINSFTCNCTGTGFNGTICENNIDDCDPNPCLNNGTCIDGINCNFFSFSFSFYFVRFISAHFVLKLLYSQTIVYTCHCQSGFDGLTCNNNINECLDGTNDCHPFATCIDTIGSFTCTCISGYEGNGLNCTGITLLLLWLFSFPSIIYLLIVIDFQQLNAPLYQLVMQTIQQHWQEIRH